MTKGGRELRTIAVWRTPVHPQYDRHMTVPNDTNALIDPMRDEHAYFLGLLATDGNISETTRNRGRISFELGSRDADVLRSLAERIPAAGHLSTRSRTTNFRTGYESTVLAFHDLTLRREVAVLGYVAGRKFDTVGPPVGPYDERGFWRRRH